MPRSEHDEDDAATKTTRGGGEGVKLVDEKSARRSNLIDEQR